MDLAKAVRPFQFRIDAVNPVEGKKNIIEALIRKPKVTGIHDSEINALNQLARLLDHLRDKVDACDRMSHSLEEKARSTATAADVEDPTGSFKMGFENSFLHRKKVKPAVLLQSLFTGKGVFISQFLLGKFHPLLFRAFKLAAILHNLCKFHKKIIGAAAQLTAPEILTCERTALGSGRENLAT
jgi:hypothetical protein